RLRRLLLQPRDNLLRSLGEKSFIAQLPIGASKLFIVLLQLLVEPLPLRRNINLFFICQPEGEIDRRPSIRRVERPLCRKSEAGYACKFFNHLTVCRG